MAGILFYANSDNLVMELAAAARYVAKLTGAAALAACVNNAAQAARLAEAGFTVKSLIVPGLEPADTAAMASVLQQAAAAVDADTVLLASDRRGKELAGRLAEAWGAGCLTDVKEMQQQEGRLVVARNSLGGATVALQAFISPRRVVAVAPRAFAPADAEGAGTVEDLAVTAPAAAVKVLERRPRPGGDVDIQAAERLVIVGQGVEDQDDLSLVEEIARALQAEIACSKPVATDKKWYSEERIIGLSGKTCKPALALVLGVSGQVQFTVGIRDAGTIVSINSDENAYMNQISDYVLVADLKSALPELRQGLR